MGDAELAEGATVKSRGVPCTEFIPGTGIVRHPGARRFLRRVRSGKQLCDSLGFDEFAGLLEVIVNDRFGIDAKRMVKAGEQFHGMNGIFCWTAAGFVRFAVNIAALRTGTRHNRRITIWPMVAAVRAI